MRSTISSWIRKRGWLRRPLSWLHLIFLYLIIHLCFDNSSFFFLNYCLYLRPVFTGEGINTVASAWYITHSQIHSKEWAILNPQWWFRNIIVLPVAEKEIKFELRNVGALRLQGLLVDPTISIVIHVFLVYHRSNIILIKNWLIFCWLSERYKFSRSCIIYCLIFENLPHFFHRFDIVSGHSIFECFGGFKVLDDLLTRLRFLHILQYYFQANSIYTWQILAAAHNTDIDKFVVG